MGNLPHSSMEIAFGKWIEKGLDFQRRIKILLCQCDAKSHWHSKNRSSAGVSSPLRAASATFALKAGECVRRFRFILFRILVAGHYDRLTPQLFHSTNCPNSGSHLFNASSDGT